MDEIELMQALYGWKAKNKLSKQQLLNLVESYRRVWQFHSGDYTCSHLLPELPSRVKTSGDYLIPSGSETPKVINWYKLTGKGQNLTKSLEVVLPWSAELNQQLFEIQFKF